MKCPRCNSHGKGIGIFPIYADDVPNEERKQYIEYDCDICDSTGIVDDKFPERETRGDKLREIRLNHNITYRRFTEMFNEKSGKISQFERGKLLPKEDEDKILSYYEKLKGLKNV